MFWVYYYLLPALAAWKMRKKSLTEAVFALYGTMLAVFLAIWCEAPVREGLLRCIPHGKAQIPWFTSAAVFLIWFIVTVVFKQVTVRLVKDGLETIVFPEKIEKFLSPCVVFLNWGLLCAMLFVIVSAMPLAKYTAFVTQDPSLCSGTRYRVLWSSFFIDRLSFQQAGVNMRRRALDRFVPEDPASVKKPVAADRKSREK